MHVARLVVENFGPYRGRHELALGPGVFGVVARHDDDAGRSNWLGKSWLLGALRFALHGRLPSGCEDADGWITRGEPSGFVGLELSDGTRVKRSRKRGDPTRLDVLRGGEVANQKRAQEVVDEVVGLSREDFEAAMVVAQKATARMVTDDPAERTKLVDGWLGLAPLRVAEDYALDKARAGGASVEAADAAMARLGEVSDPAALRVAAGAVEADLGKAQAALAVAREADAQAEAERQAEARRASLAAEFDRVVAQGIAARDRLAAMSDAASPEPGAAATATAAADRTRRRASELAGLCRGQFDGTCPVTSGACPVADEIRASGATMKAQADTAAAEAAQARAAASAATAAEQAHTRSQEARAGAERELERLREHARTVQAEIEKLGEPVEAAGGGTREAVESAAATAARLREQLAQLQREVKTAEDGVARRGAAQAALDAARQDEREWAAAAAVIRSARRRLAASVLAEIERGANLLLTDVGAGLVVRVRWEREGKDLASVCDACGAPFAASKAERQCRRCGATRGPNRIERLDVIPEPRSGAAEDLAGLAFQLAAAEWLRRRRGAAWSCVLIDEPFGAMDTTLSRAAATSLVAMLRLGRGFEQALIVTHGEAIQDVMPARVVVRSDGVSSRVEVER